MTTLGVVLVAASALAFFALTALEARTSRRHRMQALQCVGLLVAIALIWQEATRSPGRIAFGPDDPPVVLLVLMFVALVLGVLGRRVFDLGQLRLHGAQKALAASPIVFVPLLGAVQSRQAVGWFEGVSLCLIAYQNGFFWKTVFSEAADGKDGGKEDDEADTGSAAGDDSPQLGGTGTPA